MRRIACIVSLLGAAVTSLFAVGAVSQAHWAAGVEVLEATVLVLAASLWVWSGVMLLWQPSRRAWLGSLSGNVVPVAFAGREFLRLQELMWRAELGDSQVRLDPGLGIPWLFSAILIFLSVAVLGVLATIPLLERRETISTGRVCAATPRSASQISPGAELIEKIQDARG